MKKILLFSGLGIGIVGVSFLALKFFPALGKGVKMIENGLVVSIEYTLSDENGSLLESNKGKEPLTFTHGEGQIIPGLEKGLSGMKLNEEKNILVKPEDAYGPVNPQAFQEIPRKDLPAEAQKVGVTLMARSQEGQTYPVRVSELKDQTAVLDFNHPLAGKTLVFDVKVLEIQATDAK